MGMLLLHAVFCVRAAPSQGNKEEWSLIEKGTGSKLTGGGAEPFSSLTKSKAAGGCCKLHDTSVERPMRGHLLSLDSDEI